MKLFNLVAVATIYASTYSWSITPTPLISPVPSPDEIARIQQVTPAPDERIHALRIYFEAKKSPLVETESTFIRISDKYDLDWTLLPAIAGVESGFEKAGNTSDYNPFGYMCKGRPCVFRSFDEGIETVGRTIGTNRAYAKFRDGRSTLELARVYNYVSPEDWTGKIRHFQKDLIKLLNK